MNRIDPAAGKNMDLVFLPKLAGITIRKKKKKKGGVAIRLKYTIDRSRSITW